MGGGNTMLRLYIADVDNAFVSWVRACVGQCHAIEIVGTAGNGRRAMNDIMRLAPDVLLTDITLPELDGITLLRQTRRLRRPPAVVICTRFYSNAGVECASRYGASFFLYKPVDPDCLLSTILDCAQCTPTAPPQGDDVDRDAQFLQQRAEIGRALLKEFGISPRLRGGAYIVEIIVRFHDKPLLLRNLSQGLYAALAEQMDVSATSVERALRSAIDIAYRRGALEAHFKSRPSNREFIEYTLRRVNAAGSRDAAGDVD